VTRYETAAEADVRRRAAWLAGVRAQRGQMGAPDLKGVADLVRLDYEDCEGGHALLVAVLRVERGLKRPGVCPVSPEPFSPGAG